MSMPKEYNTRRTDGQINFGASSPAYPAFTWYVPTSSTIAFTSSARIYVMNVSPS
jgi:hypothetical protein